MTNDQKATISGAIVGLGAAVAIFFPQFGDIIQQISAAIAVLAVTFLGYYTNKPDA
jgi:hypothetical protein